MSDAESERLLWAFLAGMLVTLALAALGGHVTEPTPEQMYEFRDRLCSGYDPSERGDTDHE